MWVHTAPVAVVGAATLTPAGSLDETFDALCASTPTAARDPQLARWGVRPEYSCRVHGLQQLAVDEFGAQQARRMDGPAIMALHAALAAVADAGLDPTGWDPTRVGVVIGQGSSSLQQWQTPFDLMRDGRPERIHYASIIRSIPSAPAGQVALHLAAQGPVRAVSTACASGLTAIAQGQELLNSDRVDAAIIGGAEDLTQPMPVATFASMRALADPDADPHTASRPFDTARSGFVPAAGAGVLVLMRPEDARAAGLRVRALILSACEASDGHHVAEPHPDGRGLAHATRGALRAAGLTPGDIGSISAHATSTDKGDRSEIAAYRTVFGTSIPPITAIKSVLGHSSGGAGGVAAACSVRSVEDQLVPPIANLRTPEFTDVDLVTGEPRKETGPQLVAAAGFMGHNAAVIVHPA